MAQDTTPALVLYVGDGSQTRFEVPFDKGAYGEIKVAFVRRGLTDYTYNPDTYTVSGYLYAWNGGVYTKTETVNTTTPLYDKYGEATGDTWTEGMYREPKNDIFTQAVVEWTGDVLTTNDVICIVRDTVKDQPYTYPNNQKHIERALDNLARQIQELQLTADNALKVDPSWNYTLEDPNKMDPIAWLQTIVRSKGKTLRELRVDNGYIAYTADDPDSTTKTWEVLAGVKTGAAGTISHIRENEIILEDNTHVPYLEYSVDGGNSWKTAGSMGASTWGNIYGDITNQADLFDTFVKKTGDTMTGTLTLTSAGAMFPVEIKHSGGEYTPTLYFKSASNLSPAIIMDMLSSTIRPYPSSSGYGTLGASNGHWERIYVNKINNGADILVPVTSAQDTMALKSQVDLAANSGRMITAQGLWYAKMDSATVAPAAEDGTNYADFSQVDGQGNPVIVTYNRVSGAWVQDQTITPPAEYDGYVPITSKIWDIPEQAGQQGGRILWNHVSKEFTPYPQIVSFDSIEVTGTSTVVMPNNPANGQIVNKQYVDGAITTASTSIESQILPQITDIVVTDITGVITVTLSKTATPAIKAALGGTAIAGSWANIDNVYTFTPTTVADILDSDWVITLS